MKNVLILFILLGACTPLYQSSVNSGSNPKNLRFIDFAYEPDIKTIQLFPVVGNKPLFFQPAVTQLGQWNLMLEFDDLHDQNERYYARVMHCQANWSKSNLQDLDFLTEFNEFPINSFEFSVDTQIPYVHYRFALPPVKLPGNYLLVVYREGNKDDIILTKRFMVFDSRVRFVNEQNLVGAGSVAAVNQQINFTVDYKNLEVPNPLDNIKVAIRQNQRWDNILSDIRPSFIRELQQQLEYRVFEDAKMFKGGNEFRFFDLRSINNPGQNVQSVDRTANPVKAFVMTDKNRSGGVYSQYEDQNGNFIISNLDYRDLSFTNYVNVNFTLASPQPVSGEVYVTGAFSYWNETESNRMHYDSAKRAYHAQVMLKQGWYDYQYLVRSATLPPYFFEGSYFQTENEYEIFVYYHPPFQPQADLLVGYLRLAKNPH